MITGIEHTAIAAANIEKLAEWYVDTLGFVVNYKSASAMFVRASNGTMIEIIQAEGERGEQGMKSPGVRHLALTVEDFDAAYSALKEKQVNFLTEAMESKGNRVVFFTDPEGNILHLLHRAQPLPPSL